MADFSTRNIIDYAQDGDGVEFRKALYGAIHDKVAAHVEAAKIAVAQHMMRDQEDDQEEIEDGASDEDTNQG